MICRHGEVSRAMRNRCIELCLLPRPAAQEEEGGSPSAPGGVADPATGAEQDLLACLAAEGVPGVELPEAFVAAHTAVAAHCEGMHM